MLVPLGTYRVNQAFVLISHILEYSFLLPCSQRTQIQLLCAAESILSVEKPLPDLTITYFTPGSRSWCLTRPPLHAW